MDASAAALEVAIEVAILVAIALPFVRLAACRPFVRRLGGAPEQAIVGVAALIAYAAIVAGTAVVAPVLLRPMAVVAVLLAGAAWWRIGLAGAVVMSRFCHTSAGGTRKRVGVAPGISARA